jgi:hypothetical protein
VAMKLFFFDFSTYQHDLRYVWLMFKAFHLTASMNKKEEKQKQKQKQGQSNKNKNKNKGVY